jgi:hypothetical protein
MEDWIQKAITNWQSHTVKMNPPATIVEIEYTESVLNFKFPEDFKTLYLSVNGFKDWDWQEHMFTFWPLGVIIEEFDEADKGFIGFSDFLLRSHVIGFRRDEVGIFKIYPSIEHEEPQSIAQSFEQVVDMINSSNNLIY